LYTYMIQLYSFKHLMIIYIILEKYSIELNELNSSLT
jgi:hypothetical protein